MIKKINEQIAIYQTPNGALQLKTDTDSETIWASLVQIASLFGTDKSGISRHIKNIYQSRELNKKGTVANFAIVQKEGERKVTRNVEHFSLDLILSVGYRINSKKATHFRQWASKILKEHLQKGYTINPQRLQKNHKQFLKAIEDVKTLLHAKTVIDHDKIFDLITLFADTWFSLDAYDKDKLVLKGTTKKKVALTAEKLNLGLSELKRNLITKGEATEIFGVERTKDSIAGIIGNVMQSFGDEELYPSVEAKAANLLYFIVKNHPFVDGNKRSGAYAFIWYLRQAKILDVTKISPAALTAITLLVAESSPKDKEKMVGLICGFLNPKHN